MRIKRDLAAVAGRQWGLVHWSQLIALGTTGTTISRWVAEGYLQVVLPRVYAVGHLARSVEVDLVAAVLYAGPRAMLSHTTAAWWREWTDRRPSAIEVSTPRCCRSRSGLGVHGRRAIERTWHNRLPITTVSQTLLDYASTHPLNDVRYWPQYRLVVELDGRKGHSTERQVTRDHGRDLILRRHRIVVRRFAEPQVLYEGDLVLQDLLSAIAAA